MHVLATPIISVATKPRVEPSEHTENEDEASSSGVHASAAPAASAAAATPVALAAPAEGLLGLRSGMRPIQANGTLPGFGKAEDRRQLAYVHFEPTEGNDVRPEPPAGIVEGVTFVEPRAVPGNGSDLDSVILGPGVHGEAAVQRRSPMRNAPTVRTRARLRPAEDSEPQAATSTPTRRSATLLAALIAVALLMTGVSALLRHESATGEESALNQAEAAAQEPRAPEHARVDVQAASPQPSLEAPSLLEAPSNANLASLPAAPLEPGPEVSVAPEVVRTTVLARPAQPSVVAERSVAKRAVRSRADSSGALKATVESAQPAEGKSWIKVRE
jgi:hypothetical protein